jgi:hypothetical protein
VFEFSSEMSPAEALLVSLMLASNKLLIPSYQMTAENWVARLRKQQTQPASRGVAPYDPETDSDKSSSLLKAAKWAAIALSVVEVGLKDPRSEISVGADRFLDALGFIR